MTRGEFLNSLYHRLGSLDREQAEQHLTYYAEMLMDRMEEGMSEEEAVASMEDVETIASRILQDEGCAEAPRAPEAPRFPDMPKGEAGQFTHVPKTLRRNWRRPAQIALWALAVAVALGSAGSRLFSASKMEETAVWEACDTALVQEAVDFGIALTEDTAEGGLVLGSVRISPKGIEGDNFSITPDGIFVTGGEHEVYVGPEGVYVQGAEAEHTPGGVLCGTWEIPLTNVESIHINWIGGNVAVRGYDGEAIRIQQYADELLTENQKVCPVLEEMELYIDNPPGESRLLLLLPEYAAGSLFVDTYSNGVVLENVALDRICVSTTSGDTSVSGAAAQTLSLETSSGGVFLRDAGAETISISGGSGVSTSSGDVTLTVAGGELYMDTSSGQVDLTLPEGAEVLNVDTTSGDVRLDWPGEHGFLLTYDTSSGRLRSADITFSVVDDFYSWGDGSCQLYVDTSSGDLTFA